MTISTDGKKRYNLYYNGIKERIKYWKEKKVFLIFYTIIFLFSFVISRLTETEIQRKRNVALVNSIFSFLFNILFYFFLFVVNFLLFFCLRDYKWGFS